MKPTIAHNDIDYDWRWSHGDENVELFMMIQYQNSSNQALHTHVMIHHECQVNQNAKC